MENWLLRAETICMECGGHCCDEAHPPVSSACYERLTTAGVSPDMFEFVGYNRLKTRENGECILSQNGKCSIHAFKPETCRSGPFTFDMNGDKIAIYLKHEKICPIVGLLKEVPEAYRQQYELAVQSITHLVRNLHEDELAAICCIDEPETEKVAEILR
ncbi:MAG: YkgJ family cysteine cluster protein [Methanoregula sp.]|nr:YkgJ family cysteine cluster protein [Methanoregula sp.]